MVLPLSPLRQPGAFPVLPILAHLSRVYDFCNHTQPYIPANSANSANRYPANRAMQG
jgi:hypothetical protein